MFMTKLNNLTIYYNKDTSPEVFNTARKSLDDAGIKYMLMRASDLRQDEIAFETRTDIYFGLETLDRLFMVDRIKKRDIAA